MREDVPKEKSHKHFRNLFAELSIMDNKQTHEVMPMKEKSSSLLGSYSRRAFLEKARRERLELNGDVKCLKR